MSKNPSATKIIAAIVATGALYWLVDNINTHGNDVRRGVANVLARPLAVRPSASDVNRDRRSETGGLDLIDVYECMCDAPLSTDISGWVGLWFVTALIGGLPTAILLRLNVPAYGRVRY